METDTVIFNRMNYEEISPDTGEVLRYLGVPSLEIKNKSLSEFDSQLVNMVYRGISELYPALHPQGLYSVYNITSTEDDKAKNIIRFADTFVQSRDLSNNLRNCTKLCILAGTIGSQVDLIIKKYIKLDSAMASTVQAAGAMFVEVYIDMLNKIISTEAEKEGYKTHPRFSPGYGDVDLSFQKEFFRLLPCSSKLGISLLQTNFMAPSKSVTAFIGLESLT